MLFVVLAVDGLVSFGPDKGYMKQAGEWIKETRRDTDTVFANEQILLYYAGEQDITAKQQNYSWEHTVSVLREGKKIDYYAIRVSRKFPAREEEVEAVLGEPVMRFSNRRGDKVLVFAGKKTESSRVYDLVLEGGDTI
jgi:hypothetical protein